MTEIFHTDEGQWIGMWNIFSSQMLCYSSNNNIAYFQRLLALPPPLPLFPSALQEASNNTFHEKRLNFFWIFKLS